MSSNKSEKTEIVPSEFIIIGGTGNLSKRKILPALFWRFLDKQIDQKSNIILCDRNMGLNSDFIKELKSFCAEVLDADKDNHKKWKTFIEIIKFVELDVITGKGHLDLVSILKLKVDPGRPIIFYLAIASNLFGECCRFIRDSGFNISQSRIVIEKPIGRDKVTANEINKQITDVFKESQIYRIDHYLGKETVQNLMALRFANTFFENQWDNKNIDNVQHLHSSDRSLEVWKSLCGLLLKVKEELNRLYADPSLVGLLEFNKVYQLYTSMQLNINDDAESIRDLINRPLRICGMVHNEGKAGGGPFFVKDREGSITKQIIEAVQISKENNQQKILSESTHFNPVMMVLDLYDFDGIKHDLKEYRNDDNYFVVSKKYEGTEISFIELPGLWNGAMYKWNTLFVEIPIETFTPVKTVLDLLDPNHQPMH